MPNEPPAFQPVLPVRLPDRSRRRCGGAAVVLTVFVVALAMVVRLFLTVSGII